MTSGWAVWLVGRFGNLCVICNGLWGRGKAWGWQTWVEEAMVSCVVMGGLGLGRQQENRGLRPPSECYPKQSALPGMMLWRASEKQMGSVGAICGPQLW